MPLRPLALVSVLALGDYPLWKWSLATGHDAVALVSGLTLPLLALACLWLLALTAGRALGEARRRTRAVERQRQPRTAVKPRADASASVGAGVGSNAGVGASAGVSAATGEPARGHASAAAGTSTRSSRKLAA